MRKVRHRNKMLLCLYEIISVLKFIFSMYDRKEINFNLLSSWESFQERVQGFSTNYSVDKTKRKKKQNITIYDWWMYVNETDDHRLRNTEVNIRACPCTQDKIF